MGVKIKRVWPAPRPQTPTGALDLTEDIFKLMLAMDLIRRVNPSSICEARQDGELQIQTWMTSLGNRCRFTRQRLRKEFLSVEQQTKGRR